MNPNVKDPLNWKDYTTTATQWLAIMGGVVWAVLGSMGIAPGGPMPGVGLAVTALAGGKKGSLLEDMTTALAKGIKGKSSLFILFSLTSLSLLAFQACGHSHPLLQPDSRQAAMRVAMPYILTDCSAIEMYAGYRFDWNEVDPNGDPDFLHGFGGIIGGCNRFAKVTCNVKQKCNDAGGDCSDHVECEVVKVLTAEEEDEDPESE